jgi:hypothetical protein
MDEETLRLIKDKFVPAIVTPNHRGLCLPSDADVFKNHFKAPGNHPSAIKGGAALPGRGSLFPFTASGEPLKIDGGVKPINQQLQAVLEAFARLPEQDRAPADAKPKPDLSQLKPRVEPPAGGLTLRRYSRYLMRDGDDYRPAKSVGTTFPIYEWMPGYAAAEKKSKAAAAPEPPQTDNLWVTEAEWRGLVPVDPKAGDTFAVPETLMQRLYLYGFHIYASSESVSTWTMNAPKPAEFLKRAELNAVVEQVTSAAVVVRLQGSFRLDRPTPLLGGKDCPRSYEGQLAGVISYDRAKKALTRLDVVALGNYQGFWIGDSGSTATDGALIAFAFELAGGNAALVDTAPAAAINDRARYLAGGK